MSRDPRSPTTARYPARDYLLDLPYRPRMRALALRAAVLAALELERLTAVAEPDPGAVRARAEVILAGLPRDPAEVIEARRRVIASASTPTRNATA